jgi:hypothetical protein
MDTKLQTKINNDNRNQFYQRVYCQQLETKQQLVNLEMFSNDCVLIDSCGWHYQNIFFNKKIIKLETLTTALQYKLERNQFDKLIDDGPNRPIQWPELNLSNPVLIFDRSPMLKYLVPEQISSILAAVATRYQAEDLVVNLNIKFIDDSRLADRFFTLSTVGMLDFTVREFVYSCHDNKLFIHFKRNHDI